MDEDSKKMLDTTKEAIKVLEDNMSFGINNEMKSIIGEEINRMKSELENYLKNKKMQFDKLDVNEIDKNNLRVLQGEVNALLERLEGMEGSMLLENKNKIEQEVDVLESQDLPNFEDSVSGFEQEIEEEVESIDDFEPEVNDNEGDEKSENLEIEENEDIELENNVQIENIEEKYGNQVGIENPTEEYIKKARSIVRSRSNIKQPEQVEGKIERVASLVIKEVSASLNPTEQKEEVAEKNEKVYDEYSK